MLPHTRWFILTSIVWLSSITAVKPVESSSESYVATTTTIRGDTGIGFRDTFFAIQMVQPYVAAGVVSSVSSNTIVDTNATWQQDQYNRLFFAEFENGLMADVVQTDAAQHRLVFSGNLPPTIPVGSFYRIRKHFTIDDIFGPHNEAGLKPGNNPLQADYIELSGSIPRHIMFYTPENRWVCLGTNGFEPAGQIIVYPEKGILVRRKAPGDVVLHLQGQVKETTTQVPIYPGYNVVGALKGCRTLTLGELNLYTGNLATGVNQAANPKLSDNIYLYNPASGFPEKYFYSLTDFFGDGKTGWRNQTLAISDDVPIPPGSVLMIDRKSSQGFTWAIPPE